MGVAMVRLTFLLLFFGVATTANAEAQLAGPVPMPAPSADSFCRKAPCSPGCSQEVSCEDYDPRKDSCSNKGHVLVNWTCSSPCSCSSDGSVVCSVGYRCVDMVEEMTELRRLQKPTIELSQPTLPAKEETPESASSAEESDSGEPMR
jgi:hypothetical protein